MSLPRLTETQKCCRSFHRCALISKPSGQVAVQSLFFLNLVCFLKRHFVRESVSLDRFGVVEARLDIPVTHARINPPHLLDPLNPAPPDLCLVKRSTPESHCFGLTASFLIECSSVDGGSRFWRRRIGEVTESSAAACCYLFPD